MCVCVCYCYYIQLARSEEKEEEEKQDEEEEEVITKPRIQCCPFSLNLKYVTPPSNECSNNTIHVTYLNYFEFK